MSRTVTVARARAQSKGEQTRRMILDRALSLVGEVGMEGLSIGVLAEDTRLSKSGLFAHFKSKEALQLDVMQEAVERFIHKVVQPALAAPRGEQRVRRLFDSYLRWIRGEEGGRGCLFQKMSSEYADRGGAVRDRLVASLKDWNEQIGRAVAGAVEQKQFRADLDVAQFVHEFMGAAMVYQQACRLMRDPAAEKRAAAVFAALLERSRVPAKSRR